VAAARLARARGAAEAVDVLRPVAGQPHLHDGGDVGVVHASGGDVAGEHGAARPLTELLGDARALRLRLAAVHLEHLDADAVEELGVELREARGHEEDDHLEVALLRHELTQQREELGGLRRRHAHRGALLDLRVGRLVLAHGIDHAHLVRVRVRVGVGVGIRVRVRGRGVGMGLGLGLG
jgi:hypothetical protein